MGIPDTTSARCLQVDERAFWDTVGRSAARLGPTSDSAASRAPARWLA
jgi:hypothetical protein